MKQETTFKELKKSGYTDRTINEEMRANLTQKLRDKQPVFRTGYQSLVYEDVNDLERCLI